ncbi:MAG TPA: phosphatase PAP2 family protein [Chthoniobacterales bacterium]|jgi:membrane-associated phospholipid phosphatase|nr:phosphatase PAP2 family protein [Chthoniobacterales bacterium]
MNAQRVAPSQENRPRTAALPVWLDLVIWLAVLIVVACLGFYFDQMVVGAIAGHQIRWLEQVAGIISKFGDWPELMGYATVALIGVGFARKRTLVKVILCMMIAGTLAGALTNSVRLLSGRARPNNHEVPPGWYGLRYQDQWLLGKYKFHSFPSGHTATAFAFFGVIGFAYRHRWAWSFLVVASVIAWSRLYINAHFFSDLLVGVVVGLLFAQLTWERAGPLLEPRLKLGSMTNDK